MVRVTLLALAVIICIAIDAGSCTNHVPAAEWDLYKKTFGKEYVGIADSLAQFYYAYNKNLIINHNKLYDRGLKTFTLSVNYFTDMRLIQFTAQFPPTSPLPVSNASPAPQVTVAPNTYNPMTSFGFTFNAEDQGFKCNSGWAYAAAKSVEILQAVQMGILNPNSLSAQNLIDCSGRTTACKSQVPQTAFDYLAVNNMDLLPESAYKNNNTLAEPGMCLAKGTPAAKLVEYATFTSGDDFTLKAYVGAGYPVVVEINPTSFEFMHYGGGVFQPPRTTAKGSHYGLVVGYDRDEVKGLDYWIVLNSFGKMWGENGYIRILRSPAVKLAINPIFPTVRG